MRQSTATISRESMLDIHGQKTLLEKREIHALEKNTNEDALGVSPG